MSTLYDAQRAAIVQAISTASPLSRTYDYWKHPLDTAPDRLIELFGRDSEIGDVIDTWFFTRRSAPSAPNTNQVYSGQDKRAIRERLEYWDIEHWQTLIDPDNIQPVNPNVKPSEYAFNNLIDAVGLQLASHPAIRALATQRAFDNGGLRVVVEDISLNSEQALWLADIMHCHQAELTLTFRYKYNA